MGKKEAKVKRSSFRKEEIKTCQKSSFRGKVKMGQKAINKRALENPLFLKGGLL
jgi:hypothetical protein